MEDYCNVTFDRDNLPGGVRIALYKCMAYDPNNYGIRSEKLENMSQTYATPDELKQELYGHLSKYCRPHLVGDKSKRPYIDGR